MTREKRDENGMPLPVKTEPSPALRLPTAAEQRPKEDTFGQERTDGDTHGQERTAASGKKKPIGEEEIAEAQAIMKRYFNGKKRFDERYKDNFKVYNLLYNEQTDKQYQKDSRGNLKEAPIAKRIGGQTLNVILNKHADAMDNYPEPIFLAREQSDEKTANMLNSIVPCVLERNRFEKTYSEAWTDKLVGGADCIAVTWDSDRDFGLGDISISRCNILCLAWQPFVEDIQKSDHLFYVSYMDVEAVKKAYPALKDVSTEDLGLSEYETYDANSKTENKAAVVDWYYKKDGLLHFCKFCGNQVIFASENEPEEYPKGFYEHGRYPFVVGCMFPLRDTPVGFSFIDICRAPQEELDALKRDILKNIKVNSQTRNLVDDQAGVNAEDLADLNKEFVYVDNMQGSNRVVIPMETKDIAPGALSMYNALTDEIKKTTGTNDASNGASAAGVTSGSAIAALQEAGGKISRDISKGGFREFTEICELVLENIRQFYNPERWFRIVGEDKKTEYVQFGNENLREQDVAVDGADEPFQRLPVFDIRVKAQRSNPFTTAANNQMMVDLFRMGAFAPENADAALNMLECMSFEGKDKLTERIKQNAQLLQAVQQLQGRVQMLEAMMNQQTADAMTPGMQPGQPAPAAAEAPPMQLPMNRSEGARI